MQTDIYVHMYKIYISVLTLLDMLLKYFYISGQG